MDIGIEIRVIAPPTFIPFIPITIPSSEIAPVNNNETDRITGVGLNSRRNMLPWNIYKDAPIPLTINPPFFLLDVIFFKLLHIN